MALQSLSQKAHHQPVLYQEIIQALRPEPEGFYLDCTVGAGGHGIGILQASAPSGRLLGLDVDPEALSLAHARLKSYGSRVTLVQASYTKLGEQLTGIGWNQVNGILLDLGASSMQFGSAERGFSFQKDGPLDMRFDPQASITAADLVNELPEKDLADILWRYGEERYSRRIARAIVDGRPIRSTRKLVAVILKAIPHRRRRIHPATRTFQALRIAVNSELEALETVLPQAVDALAPKGRLAVISFHSLEDRMVKQFFRKESRDCVCPDDLPYCSCDHRKSILVLTRKPITPQTSEVQQNPRARSAKLRLAEKINV
jgi:16S rRNA (cytosine1402-N4)-methyltransferase